jgi:hypothetical protein
VDFQGIEAGRLSSFGPDIKFGLQMHIVLAPRKVSQYLVAAKVSQKVNVAVLEGNPC